MITFCLLGLGKVCVVFLSGVPFGLSYFVVFSPVVVLYFYLNKFVQSINLPEAKAVEQLLLLLSSKSGG